MFMKLFLAAALAANGVASAPAANTTSKASPSPNRVQYAGDATFYYPNGGYGACGAPLQNWDYIVALSPSDYQGGAHCWQHIAVWLGSRYVDVTIGDLCPGCNPGDLDLSPVAFQQFASLEVGRIHNIGWYFE